MLAEPAVQQELIGMGYDLAEGEARDFQHVIREDLDRFAVAARRMGLKVN